MQHVDVIGQSNTVIQVTGDGNVLNLCPDLPALHLESFTSPLLKVTEGKPSEPGFTPTGKLETDLLIPYTRALPLVGRQAFLKRLNAWLDDPAPISVTVIVGAGGRGKTRVALELCADAAPRGWLAGFVTHDELARFRAHKAVATWSWPKPTLAVVDYAAAKAELLRAWLADLTRHEQAWTVPNHPKLRLLLLERHGERDRGWIARMFSDDDPSSRAYRLLDPDAPLTLCPLTKREERRAVFAEAYRLARGEAPHAPELDRQLEALSAGGEPLLIIMAGIYAARSNITDALAKNPDTLALEIARWELARVRKVWTARGLNLVPDRALPDHLVAVATLRNGLPETAANAVISEEAKALFQADIAPAGASDRALSALREALPAEDGGVAPIRPELIGGAALIAAWGDRPHGMEALRRAVKAAPAAVAATVIRVCQDFVIRGYRAPLAWLRVIRDEIKDLEGMLTFANALPSETVKLRKMALRVMQALVIQLRRSDPMSEQDKALLAWAQNNLSHRFSSLGQWDQALLAIEEAVQLYRALAQLRRDVYLPGLAMALNNLSNRLSDVGRRTEALEAIEEAVEIYRTLAKDRLEFLPDLAMSLNNISTRLGDLGKHAQALTAIEEGVVHYRALARTRPETFVPNLAKSLNNLSKCLAGLNRGEQAVGAIKEAVVYCRLAVQTQPDAFLPDFGRMLNTMSNQLSAVGQHKDALETIQEAVKIFRTLVKDCPSVFLSDLAMSLNNMSNRLLEMGQRDEAVAAGREAVAIYDHLTKTNRDAFLPGLAGSLNDLSICLSELESPEEALATAEKAVAISRQLTNANRDAYQRYLANSLNQLAICLANLGRREQSLMAIQEAVEIYQELAQSNRDAFLPYLVRSLNNMANCLSDLRRYEDALAANEEAVRICRTLVQSHPSQFLPELAGSLNNLSARFRDLGRWEHAAVPAIEAVVHYRELARQYPDAYLVNLAGALSNLSEYLVILKRDENALEAIEEAVKIYRTLTGGRLGPLMLNLADALTTMARQLFVFRRYEDALEAIEEAVMNHQSLAQHFPDKVVPGLARSLGVRGLIIREKDPAAAAKSFRDGIEALRDKFLVFQQAHAGLMKSLVRDYIDACKAAGTTIDDRLLAPITAAMQGVDSSRN